MLAYRGIGVLIGLGCPACLRLCVVCPPLPAKWGVGRGEGQLFTRLNTNLRSPRVPAQRVYRGVKRTTYFLVIPAQAGIQGSNDALRHVSLTLTLSPKGRGDERRSCYRFSFCRAASRNATIRSPTNFRVGSCVSLPSASKRSCAVPTITSGLLMKRRSR
ncbi:MAG: hypothetical protein JWR07_3247 [Nevskia sp.]|nr:hypothetical protein [Nevskia sp.]